MHCNRSAARAAATLALLMAIVLTSGCSYLNDRYHDAADMIDIGVTFSKTPYFAAYVDAPFITLEPLGYGHVDGYSVGIGSGQLNWFNPCYENNMGLAVWGDEAYSFQYSESELNAMTEEDRDKATHHQGSGIVGVFTGPTPTPGEFVSCPHYIHLGWIGLVGSPHYWEMLDFLVGWTTLDISCDDGRDQKKPVMVKPVAKAEAKTDAKADTKTDAKADAKPAPAAQPAASAPKAAPAAQPAAQPAPKAAAAPAGSM